jgi:hypothetical protein
MCYTGFVMTIQERIARNRAMDDRIAAKAEAERPTREAKHKASLAHDITTLVFSLPEEHQKDFARLVIRQMRPDIADKYGI